MDFFQLRDDNFWKNVRESDDFQFARDELTALYHENCTGKPPLLTHSDYCLFFETGSRKEYEDVYFLRRRRLAILGVLCKIYPENKEYFQNLENTVWAVLDEYSWTLPAHVPDKDSYVPDFIDLFAAETGYCLSEIKFMYQDRFSPLMISRITFELDRRIIKSFYANRFWWETANSNWAAVCAGSVGITFMHERPELFWQIKPRIDGAMSAFLSSYKPDGACREGLFYWYYGFGYYCYYADHLRTISGGKYDMFSKDLVKTIAGFQQYAVLKGDVAVTFADFHDEKLGRGLTYLLKSVYGDKIEIPPDGNYTLLNLGGRWASLSYFFLCYDKKYTTVQTPGEILFSDSSWFMKRQTTYAFAAKGGDNDEPHNHNDLGSFILTDGISQLICDLGSGEYTRQYFAPETRYTILCNSSLGHSVPIVGGEAQQPGADAYAELLKTEEGILIDLTHAYKTDGTKSIKRSFCFSENSVTLSDEFSFDRPTPVTERFVSRIKPEIKDGAVKIGSMHFPFGTLAPKITEQYHFEHNTGDKTTVYLVDFELGAQKDSTFTLTFIF